MQATKQCFIGYFLNLYPNSIASFNISGLKKTAQDFSSADVQVFKAIMQAII